MRLKLFLGLLFLIFLPLFSVQATSRYTPMAGDLIKTPNSPAVYIIDDNFRRHLFSTAATFWTWYDGTWADLNLKVISVDDFDQLEMGKNVTVRPGSNLIQFDNSNRVYAVTPGGVLCEARALYGVNWQNRVIKIPASFETDYIKDSACTITSSGKLPNATLLQYVGGRDILYIDNGKKRKITEAGMKANYFKAGSIIRDVPVAMSYSNDNRTINAFDYNLSILAALKDTTGQDIAMRPDFFVYDIIVPSGTKVGQVVDIRVIIKNSGGNHISSDGLKNISFSAQDFVIQNTVTPPYPTSENPLRTNQTFEITYTGRFNSAGSKMLTFKVDEPSLVVELNENNNSLSKTFNVASN